MTPGSIVPDAGAGVKSGRAAGIGLTYELFAYAISRSGLDKGKEGDIMSLCG
jgi:hypothetical protein